MTLTTTDVDLFDRWLSLQVTSAGKHVLLIYTERDESCEDIIHELREIVHSHYVAPAIMAKRLAESGAPETAKLLEKYLPVKKQARSGDLGEILTTELAERRLSFQVPVRRLRYKDGRNMALRGDDLFAIAFDSEDHLVFLKGESKSRAQLTSSVVTEAASALDRNNGHPTELSVLFVADRLREQEKDELAHKIEQALLHSFVDSSVEHLLFTLSGNDPVAILSSHISNCTYQCRRSVIGIQIRVHSDFIERIFSEI